MHLTASLLTAVLLPATWAFPIIDETPTNVTADSPTADQTDVKTLVARIGRNDGSSYENAIDVRLDSNGWEDVANDMAYAMLCQGATVPRIFQRLEGDGEEERRPQKRRHYRASGAAARPAKPEGISKYNLRGVKVDPGQEEWATMEEIPGESANVVNEASRLVVLFPSPLTQQHSQGARLTLSLARYRVEFGQWYQITGFDNCHRAYCIAFNNNDRSVCYKKLKGNEIDPDEIAAVRISNPGQRYQFRNIGNKDWGGPSAKRDIDTSGQEIVKRPEVLSPTSDERDSLSRRAAPEPHEEYPESEFVLDDLPPIDHD